MGRLRRDAKRILGRDLTDTEVAQFGKYLIMLLKWNSTHRMIGASDPLWIIENLFLDSLLFLRALPSPFTNIVDIGSGAGIPGIPLKIVLPGVRVLLVESKHRRASFLSAVIRELRLESVDVLSDRIESAPSQWQARFDAAVARCAGRLESTLRVAATFVRPGGVVVASGSPGSRDADRGEVAVPGLRAGTRRHFVVTAV